MIQLEVPKRILNNFQEFDQGCLERFWKLSYLRIHLFSKYTHTHTWIFFTGNRLHESDNRLHSHIFEGLWLFNSFSEISSLVIDYMILVIDYQIKIQMILCCWFISSKFSICHFHKLCGNRLHEPGNRLLVQKRDLWTNLTLIKELWQ